MSSNTYPLQQLEVIHHSQCLWHSFQHWTGHDLIDSDDNPQSLAKKLFFAPCL